MPARRPARADRPVPPVGDRAAARRVATPVTSAGLPATHKDRPVVYVPDRAAWRAWLAANHAKCAGIYLAYFKQSSGLPRVSYDDAVEEALCFGWIDSVVQKFDDRAYLQLFTPRKPRGTWSALNKRRVAALIKAGLMTPAGQVHIDAAKADGRWSALDANERLEVPPDLAAALKRTTAMEAWSAFSPSSRKGILNWITSARREQTRAARVEQTARMAARGLRAQFDRE